MQQIVKFLLVAALFCTVAIHRLNWRHLLVMLSLSGLWFAVEPGITKSLLRLPFQYQYLLWITFPILIAAAGESFLAQGRTAKSLPWILLLSVAAGSFVTLVTKPLDFAEASILIPLSGLHARVQWGYLIVWPLSGTLAWIAIPAAIKLGEHAERAKRLGTAAVALLSIGGFLLFFNLLIYPVAHQSLLGSGLFSRSWAAFILDTRGNRSDQEAIWTASQRADWSKPENYETFDFRKELIHLVSVRDGKTAAIRCSTMLRDKPSQLMAAFCAKLFADHQRYEVVPLLMRYSLHGNSECTDALETMGVPQVSLAIIRFGAKYDPSPFATDSQIDQKSRERLIRILGNDAGPLMSDWGKYYDSKIDRIPTPLPTTIASETQRVIDATISYWNSFDRLYKAKCHLFVQRSDQIGNGKYLDQMIATGKQLQGQQTNLPTKTLTCPIPQR